MGIYSNRVSCCDYRERHRARYDHRYGESLMPKTVSTIVMTQIDPARVEMAYYRLASFLEEDGYTRAELMTALLVCLGVQWNGAVMGDDRQEAFIKDISEYLAAYFAKGEAV